jgi:hypothetical protein
MIDFSFEKRKNFPFNPIYSQCCHNINGQCPTSEKHQLAKYMCIPLSYQT